MPRIDPWATPITTLQNAATANGNGTEMSITGLSSMAVQITGTFSATINFEVTVDGVNWIAILGQNVNTGSQSTSAMAPGIYTFALNGLSKFRARISNYVSGSITVVGVGSALPLAALSSAIINATVDAVKIKDATGTNTLAIDASGNASVTLNGSLPKGSNPIGRVDIDRDKSSVAFYLPDLTISSQTYATSIAAKDSNLLMCVDTLYLYESTDNGETWSSVASVNNDGVGGTDRKIHLVRFDPAKGDAYVAGTFNVDGTRYLTVWVRRAGETSFSRYMLSEVVTSNLPTSLSIGRLGVFLATRGSYTVWRSTDKGQTWTSFTFDNTYFATHVHSVWASPYEAYVYVTGGDGSSLGGAYRSSDFATWTLIYREVAGLRVVPVTGTHRQRFLGIEGEGGGILTSYDDTNWIMVGERDLLSYANFHGLHVTDDGYLVLGTYQTQLTYPADRYGHGGILYISGDGGRTGVSIPLPCHDIADIASNDDYIFVVSGYAATNLFRGNYLFRIRKPDQFSLVTKNKVTRFFVNNESLGEVINSGSSTVMIDATGYKDAVLFIDSQLGTWVLQGAPYVPAFGSIYDNNNVWIDVKTLTYSERTKELVTLPVGMEKLSLFRLTNTSASSTRLYAAGMILTK